LDKSQSRQADLSMRIRSHMPAQAWDSTVAIVVANKPAVHLFGTGILFQIGDARFIITAAHVIREAHK
jgi:hypothetical protein